MNVGIKGFGAYAPEKIIDNAYFEQFLDTSDEWISKMTGIKERHWADDDQDTSDLAYEASVKAIADAGIQPEDIRYDNCCHSNWRYAISNCRKYVTRTFRDGQSCLYGSTCSMFWIYVFNDYS